jgi:peptidoglycan-associated lipoprotein
MNHMKNSMKLYAIIFGCGLFLAGGCANRDVVKKDEGMAPASAAKPAESQVAAPTPVKGQATPPAAPVRKVWETSPAARLQSALDKIYFDFDSSTMSDADRATLTKNAAALKGATNAKVRIEGNCDEHGSAEYNLALGERRAQAAKKYLTTLGVSVERLATVSYGKERLVDQGHDEAAWKKNRRDEFVVVTP